MDLPREIVHVDKAASPVVWTGNFFTRDLTEDLVAEILSKIPIKTIALCKCVCKRWRKILSEPYFANLQLPAGLITCQHFSKEYTIFSLAELDAKPDHHGINYDPLMSFNPGLGPSHIHWPLCGSVNGLVCLFKYDNVACVCNPVTREYILLPDDKYIRKCDTVSKYGFGFVKASNEYKVVCFYERCSPSTVGLDMPWCKVYTLGTGMWRSLGQVNFLVHHGNRGGLFVSGDLYWFECTDGIFVSDNLHWLVYDQKATNHERVCTFDLEKEVFQLTACPQPGDKVDCRALGMLGEYLCICDSTPRFELAIWVMKDYGQKESWSKEIMIRDESRSPFMTDCMVHPMKVFEDGSILFSTFWSLFTYDARNKTFREHKIIGSENPFSQPVSKVYVPSSISLKSFKLEKVSVF